jgi:uncharacterized membrane protein YgcG
MHRPIQSVSAAAVIATLLALPLAAHAADPTTADCLAANNRSIDLRNNHRLRLARGQLLICAANNCPADIRKECTRRVDEVNGQIPTVIFEAKDAASGKELSAVKVMMDGELIAERLEGTAISIDPGTHTFVFETAGQAPVTMADVIIVQSQKDRRETITFGSPPVAVSAGGGGTGAGVVGGGGGTGGGGTAGEGRGGDRREGGGGAQKTLGIVGVGIGVVGLGVGSVLGLMTLSKKNDAQNVCPNRCATQDGVSMWNDATNMGNISTVAFIVGGVGLVGGALLWLTAPSSTTQVGLGPSGIQWKGVW